MDLNLATVFTVLAIVVIQTSEATMFPVSFNCCTEVSHYVPRSLLRQVQMFEIQKEDGVCHLPAVILYVRYEWLCASPRNKNVRRWLQRKKSKIPRRNVDTGRKERNKSKHKIVKNTTGLK
ncbi:PREDICTED: C-C motif chemokine 28 [Gavialis gangeticus]|uniref:C-C motif chemokine 28 n=1 Tax=Gavialis gangeticus TaxID=94835 RepID=UPI00092F4E6C|nr:PREDICTED: C-C motif chemokine 28 [Gavialis gangeticus]